MKRPRLRTILGLTLLALAVGVSLWHGLTAGRQTGPASTITLRFAHMTLQPGMRESFDEAAALYHARHPHVVVEQIPVPIRAWQAWMRTQLVGETAPELLMIWNSSEELLSRYFEPLTAVLAEPNPYNHATPLEGIPWRDTFTDGLASMRRLTPTSGAIAGVPLQLNTMRLYYNRRLLREVTGSDTPPPDLATWLALSAQVQAYNERTGAGLVPVAGCGPYAQYLFEQVVPSQTQRLVERLSPMRTMNLERPEIAAAMLEGRIGYRSPEIQSAFRLMQDLAGLMPPSFKSMQREDATFTFLQQQAVMIVSGSWDFSLLRESSGFDVGVARIPMPDTSDPVYGRFALGAPSEAVTNPGAVVGVLRGREHSALAIDFLRFLTSHEVASRFVERSQRVSSVLAVPPPSGAAALAPQLAGDLPGLMIDFAYFATRHTFGVQERNLHQLTGRQGDLEQFTRTMETEGLAALRRDTEAFLSGSRREIRRMDAHLGLTLTHPVGSAPGPAWSALAENQYVRQAERLQLEAALAK